MLIVSCLLLVSREIIDVMVVAAAGDVAWYYVQQHHARTDNAMAVHHVLSRAYYYSCNEGLFHARSSRASRDNE